MTMLKTWTAPVNLTDKMLNRMIDNGSWGGMAREEVEEQLRGAWPEARYAYKAAETGRPAVSGANSQAS